MFFHWTPYRQTVLSAFQDVEDNLAALRILNEQAIIQTKASVNANKALKLSLSQYKAGIIDYSSLLTAEITAYNDEKNMVDTLGLKNVSVIGLIKSLGGGWHNVKNEQ